MIRYYHHYLIRMEKKNGKPIRPFKKKQSERMRPLLNATIGLSGILDGSVLG